MRNELKLARYHGVFLIIKFSIMIRFLFIIFCCCSFFCSAQGYRQYWTNINWAKVYSFDDSIPHNEDSTLYYCYKAYRTLPDKSRLLNQTAFTYRFLVEHHAARKEYDRVKTYLTEMSHWEPQDSTYKFVTKVCKSCDSIAHNFDAFYPANCTYKPQLKKMDTREYDSIIAVTVHQDQYIRKTPGLTRDTIFKINDENLDNFAYCLRKYGYLISLTQVDTMGQVYDFLPLFVMHTDNWPRFRKNKSTLLKALRACKLEPNPYIYGYDRARVNSGHRPTYFAFFSWQPQFEQYKPTPKELKRANRMRARLGALPYGLDAH